MLLALLGFASVSFQVHFHGPKDAPLVREVTAHVRAGAGVVEKFFGAPFGRKFTVEVCASRAELDKFFRARWHAPPTEKWMVAAGVADTLVLLSPRAWKSEAVDHSGDAKEAREVITHELVHIYHAQRNPNPEFDGMDGMAWFIEGLATYVSGQLAGRDAQIRQAIERGEPKSLAVAWTGQARYAVSGSLVRFVDVKYGRKKLVALLNEITTAGVLKSLGVDEPAMLQQWRTYEQARLRTPDSFRYLSHSVRSGRLAV